jgi:hypothetical protein
VSEDKLELEPDIDETDVDRAVAASTLVLSAIPTIVPLIAEAVKHGIPKRRIERIARMLKFLGNQVSGLEEDVLAHRMRTEEFLDLFEDGLWQTTRALTEERLAHIASLLKNSIKSDDLAHEQEKMLLSLLGQLNDSELILLGWYGTNMVGERANAYYARHEDIVGPTIRESLMSEEEERNITLRLYPKTARLSKMWAQASSTSASQLPAFFDQRVRRLRRLTNHEIVRSTIHRLAG